MRAVTGAVLRVRMQAHGLCCAVAAAQVTPVQLWQATCLPSTEPTALRGEAPGSCRRRGRTQHAAPCSLHPACTQEAVAGRACQADDALTQQHCTQQTLTQWRSTPHVWYALVTHVPGSGDPCGSHSSNSSWEMSSQCAQFLLGSLPSRLSSAETGS